MVHKNRGIIVKRIIALTSLLFVLLMAVLPANVSQVAAASDVNVSSISVFTTDGKEIKLTGSNNDFLLNLVGVAGDVKIDRVEFKSDTATTVSFFSKTSEDNSDDTDVQFSNGVATLDVAKYNKWADRVGDPQIDTDYFTTVQELRDLFEDGYYETLFVADKNGNESLLYLSIDTEGWKYAQGKWYFYDTEGALVTGWIYEGDKWYYLDQKTGVMKTGWLYYGGKWYFLDQKGVMKTDWLYTGGKWYFLDSVNGDMKKGWLLNGNKWYFLDPTNGDMKVNWVYVGGKWYFMEKSGVMKTGWLQSGKKWFYLYPVTGQMAANTTIGKYRFAADGTWIQ
jgi:glucan-binding YG repeat protein